MSSDNMSTKPTIETVLERLSSLAEYVVDFRGEVNRRFTGVDNRFDQLEKRATGIEERVGRLEERAEGADKRLANIEHLQERIEVRQDRVESIALELRADFRELRTQLKEHIPNSDDRAVSCKRREIRGAISLLILFIFEGIRSEIPFYSLQGRARRT